MGIQRTRFMIEYTKDGNVKAWNFNLSYSAFSLFKESELLFYYNKIEKAKPDTETPSIYGDLGNVIHNSIEKFKHKENTKSVNELFEEQWEKYNIDTQFQPFKKIDKKEWRNILYKALAYIKSHFYIYPQQKYEEYISIEDENYEALKVVGYIDVVCKDTQGNVILFDWKTNSSANAEAHKSQRLFYSWLYYKKYNILPRSCKWVYLKKSITFENSFTMQDILEFEKEIREFIVNVKHKGNDINKYSLGNIDGMFNEHYNKSKAEEKRRNSEHAVHLLLKNNTMYFQNIDDKLLSIMRRKYSYYVDGYHFSEKYKRRQWDGKKHFLKKKHGIWTLPLPFYDDFMKLYKEYCDYYSIASTIDVVNTNKEPKKLFKHNLTQLKDVELYDFQQEAVEICLQRKRGVLHCSVSSGKTEIAAELIRKLSKKTLFLTHQKELCKQSAQRFIDRGFKNEQVSMFTSDKNNINDCITVAMIPTLARRLKNSDTLTQLQDVGCIIVDECHHAISSNQFKKILESIYSPYVIGLSGSIPDTQQAHLELKSCIGDILYTITSNTLIQKNIVSKPQCNIINIEQEYVDDEWLEVEKHCIIENTQRNECIKKITEKEEGLIVIIVKKLSHGFELESMIEESVFLHGSMNTQERDETLYKIKNKKIRVVISTIIKEGVSINEIQTLIIACGGGVSTIPTIQQSGRVMRKHHENGEEVVKKLYDFNDVYGKYTQEHSECRIKEYQKFMDVQYKEVEKI